MKKPADQTNEEWLADYGGESVKKGSVIKTERGTLYVARTDMEIPINHRLINARPHQEGTEAEGYHYLCDNPYCRCKS